MNKYEIMFIVKTDIDEKAQKDTVKRALLIYALNSLKLGKEFASLDDKLRQLVLVNEDEVEAAVNELTNK